MTPKYINYRSTYYISRTPSSIDSLVNVNKLNDKIFRTAVKLFYI